MSDAVVQKCCADGCEKRGRYQPVLVALSLIGLPFSEKRIALRASFCTAHHRAIGNDPAKLDIPPERWLEMFAWCEQQGFRTRRSRVALAWDEPN